MCQWNVISPPLGFHNIHTCRCDVGVRHIYSKCSRCSPIQRFLMCCDWCITVIQLWFVTHCSQKIYIDWWHQAITWTNGDIYQLISTDPHSFQSNFNVKALDNYHTTASDLNCQQIDSPYCSYMYITFYNCPYWLPNHYFIGTLQRNTLASLK